MGPWQHYLIVLKQDLLALAWLLTWVGGALLVHSALIAISAAARHRRLLPRVLWIAIVIAWLVSTLAAVGSYLLGWGLVLQLYRTWGVSVTAVPLRFWMALGCTSIAIAVILSYRHTAAWLQACTDSKRAPMRASFSLATLIAYQLILLLGMGLWIECRRDWVTEQYEKQVRLAAEQARQEAYAKWVESLEVRFGGKNWTFRHGPRRFLILSVVRPLREQTSIEPTVLELIKPDDRLVVLHVRSDNLTDAGLRKIAQNVELSELHVVSTEITDDGIASLRTLTNLRYLYLSCPKLTDRCLNELPKLYEGRIWIQSPQVTREAIIDFNARILSERNLAHMSPPILKKLPDDMNASRESLFQLRTP